MTNLPATPVLVIENLSIRTATHHLVKDISLTISAGETVCLIGASGSGKSLTAQAIMGLLPQHFIVEGNMVLSGENIRSLSSEALRKKRGSSIAMVFQDPLGALNPIQTIGEQIREVLTIHKVPHKKTHKAQVCHMLEKVQLSPAKEFYSRYPHQLSGGQRQRAMIAMALILQPTILIADEPTSAVDRQTQSELLQLLQTLQQETRMAILLITHDFQVVQAAAQQVIVVNAGAVVESGSTDQILQHAQHSYTQQLVEASILQTEQPIRVDENSRTVLSVENVSYTYPTKHFLRAGTEAIQNVSFQLRAGEFLGIVGTSGSGKSTLAKAIAYLLPSYQGNILLAGREWRSMNTKERLHYRTKVQMIFQDPVHSFNPRYTIADALLEGPRNQGLVVSYETLGEWLRQVDLEDSILKRYPYQLSGGQLQRVAIARALSMQPEVLIADEAISALDVLTQHQILRMLQEYCQRSKLGLILITHDIHIAIQYCKSMMVLENGRVVPSA